MVLLLCARVCARAVAVAVSPVGTCPVTATLESHQGRVAVMEHLGRVAVP